MSALKTQFQGWLGGAVSWLFTELENAFPSLAAISASIVSGFSKAEANLIWKASRDFVQAIDNGTSWQDAFNAMIAEMKTGELSILSNEAKSFLYMFGWKSKH